MKNKRFYYSKLMLLMFAVTAMCSLHQASAQTNVTLNVDYSVQLTPATMERGYLLEAAIDKDDPGFTGKLNQMKDLGCSLVTLPRDLNQYNRNWPTDGKYYLSYRSKGGTHFGADGQPEEFKANASGGIDVNLNNDFLGICQMANNNGLRMIIQMSGTPVEGKNNGNVNQLFDLDPNRIFHESARFYAYPAANEYDNVANVLGVWMQQIQSGTGATNIIWAGQQEPSHTPGYPGGVQTNEGSKSNAIDYPKVWKPIAKKVKDLGLGATAGIQLNQSPKEHGDAIKALSENNVPMNFYSVQMYRSQDNPEILDSVITNLDKYPNTAGKRIVFNRYDTYRRKNDPLRTEFEDKAVRYNSAKGLVRFLEDELVLLDHADRMLGYTLFKGALGMSMMDEVMKFLTSMPTKRRQVTGLGSGLDGWVTATGNEMFMVLFNTSNGTKNVTVNLQNFPNKYNTHQMSARRGNGAGLGNYNAPIWNAGSNGSISNITVKKDQFILIQINAGGTSTARLADDSFIEQLLGDSEISIYPNPVRDRLEISSLESIHEMVIYDMYGKVVHSAKKAGPVIDISHLKGGMYFIRFSAPGGSGHTYKFIKE